MITKQDIIDHQQRWADQIIAIGVLARNKQSYQAEAEQCVKTLYAYDLGTVLFKPTRAVEQPFRATEADALSYFIMGHISEDTGFAINPLWAKIEFENHGFQLYTDNAIVMGEYHFTDYDGNIIKVEYTFGYVKDEQGNLRLNLQHSSVPFPG